MNVSYLFRELTRRSSRTLSAIFSVAIGITLFVSLQAYAGGYREAARAPLSEVGADITAQRQGDVPEGFTGILFPHSVAPLHRDEIEAIAELPGVEGITESLFFWSFEEDSFVAGLGFDPAADFGHGRLRAGLIEGRFLDVDDSGVTLVDASYATQNALSLGDMVIIIGNSFEIVGIVDTTRTGQIANANLYLPLADAQAMSAIAPNVLAVHDMRPDDANLIFIKSEQTQAEAVVAGAEAILGKKALVSSAESFGEQLGALFDIIDRFGVLVGLVAFLFAAGILVRAVAAGVWERRREVGMMRAVGWEKKNIVRQLLGETLVIALVGGLVGLLLSWGVTLMMSQATVTVPVPWELSPSPHFLPGGAEEVAVVVPLNAKITLELALAALGLSAVAAALVGLWLPGRIANIKPAEVLRSE
ncbi:MAG: FtsX-like permease family protein [Anaerolineae bacterium]|nr:FtsX-like permease family protein [Anaerolineae bacterium]MBT4309632.1 FtsX-like permease family protein [Anaerolineae bacterium]MBT4456995.1 FtsX-like permease family protein [Anaerolineae bacterium]MBT6060646.1 FtsX-like permease family protein [Anaerolineae bacterium]MBT6321746.1 FtsX-like permease family protein [Anaerolineae bacterium]